MEGGMGALRAICVTLNSAHRHSYSGFNPALAPDIGRSRSLIFFSSLFRPHSSLSRSTFLSSKTLSVKEAGLSAKPDVQVEVDKIKALSSLCHSPLANVCAGSKSKGA